MFRDGFERTKKAIPIFAYVSGEIGGTNVFPDSVEINENGRALLVDEEIAGMEVSVAAVLSLIHI